MLGPGRIVELQRNSDELDLKESWFGEGVFNDTKGNVEAEVRSSTRL